MIINLIVAALLIEQSINITMNITTNERLNRSRYPWMNDSLGNPYNHYDKGCIRNILEFWRFPGFEKDYYSEFNWLTLRDTMMSSAEKAEAIIENKRKESEKSESLKCQMNQTSWKSEGCPTPPSQHQQQQQQQQLQLQIQTQFQTQQHLHPSQLLPMSSNSPFRDTQIALPYRFFN